MFTWGLNKRLNTSCTELTCIEDVIISNALQGKFPATLTDAIAMPEQDIWKYGTNCEHACTNTNSGHDAYLRTLHQPHCEPHMLPDAAARCCRLHGVLRVRRARLEDWLRAGVPRLERDPGGRADAQGQLPDGAVRQ